jgi:hypothetical protein
VKHKKLFVSPFFKYKPAGANGSIRHGEKIIPISKCVNMLRNDAKTKILNIRGACRAFGKCESYSSFINDLNTRKIVGLA